MEHNDDIRRVKLHPKQRSCVLFKFCETNIITGLLLWGVGGGRLLYCYRVSSELRAKTIKKWKPFFDEVVDRDLIV